MKSTPLQSNTIGLTLDTPIDFAFNPRLSRHIFLKVWNADINRELSDYSLGIIIVTQSQSWQRTKGEIGLNFQFEEG